MHKQYKILTTAFLFSGLFLGTLIPGFCDEILNIGLEPTIVKLDTITGGLIIAKQNGVRKSYIRKEDALNKYPDFIAYTTSAFSKKTESTSCRIIFLDSFVVKFKTPNENIIEIPKKKKKNIEINIR